MFKYQILIEYVGSNFRGWQIQKKGKTIQGLIQEKVSKLLKEKITIFGSGRTDAGVHAIAQSAHFACKNKILKCDKFFFLSQNVQIVQLHELLYPFFQIQIVIFFLLIILKFFLVLVLG